MTIGSRMKEVMKANGLDQYSTAEMLGLSQPALNLYMNDKRNIPNEVIKDFCNFFKISTDVLFNENIELPTLTVPTGSSNSVSIKIIDAVACCGDGIQNIDDAVSGTWDIALADYKQLAVNSNPESVRMLQVKGDSMSPKLNTGDWVLVDTAQNFISSDGLYAIRMASGLAIKRIQSGLNEITIRSDNPAYGEITAAVGEVAIIGRVIYALHAEKLV